MRRFFITPEQFDAAKPVIRGSDANHMIKVLRMAPGDMVELLDGNGRAVRARVDYIGRDEVGCLGVEEFIPGGEPPVRVTLVQGMAKGEKMETIIQKATELGVSEIIPLACRRAVVRLDDKRSGQRLERWRKVAVEAAKQSRRAVIPVVIPPRELAGVLAAMPEDSAAFMPWEEECSLSFTQAIKGDSPSRVYLFIGPEGGFEQGEVEQAGQAGVVVVSLGPRILRTETAGPACLAILMSRWGDM